MGRVQVGSVEVALMGLETWGKGWEWDGNGMLMDFGEVQWNNYPSFGQNHRLFVVPAD